VLRRDPNRKNLLPHNKYSNLFGIFVDCGIRRSFNYSNPNGM
jgi:hypothetical protein